VRQDYPGRAAPVQMTAQQHAIGGGEGYMFAAQVLSASVRIKKASCNNGHYRCERNCYLQSMMRATS
jgi:hypothetical protein